MLSFFKSFIYAARGIRIMLLQERNFKVHVLALTIVFGAGIYFGISKFEWLAVLLISALVISLETLNSAIERLCDLYSTQQNEKIAIIKDISAGAVLIATGFALVIGLWIFLPYLLK